MASHPLTLQLIAPPNRAHHPNSRLAHVDRVIIILCVRWYLRFKLSFRNLVEMMAERGLPLAYTTIMRWLRQCAPEFGRRWNRFARPAGASWRMDETYIRARGEWVDL